MAGRILGDILPPNCCGRKKLGNDAHHHFVLTKIGNIYTCHLIVFVRKIEVGKISLHSGSITLS